MCARTIESKKEAASSNLRGRYFDAEKYVRQNCHLESKGVINVSCGMWETTLTAN